MRGSNSNATKRKSNIQCVEVLISKNSVVDNNKNLLWTLSVYSLENKPVTRNREIHNSEVFHFMVYDWTRTIHQLLEDLQVPYSIIQFFTPDDFYSATSCEAASAPHDINFHPEDNAPVSSSVLTTPSTMQRQELEASVLH